jgi:endonuclease YncB( thermonuclease family)
MLRALLLALIGSASFAAVYLSIPLEPVQDPEEHEEIVDAPALAADPIEFALRPSESANEAPSAESVAPVVRDVTPANMTATPPADEPPTPAAADEASESKPRMQRLYRPIVVSAGVVKAREREIRLAGIDAPAFAERCGEGAAAWPCGRMARAALRRFIRGRAIECEIPAEADALPDAARCEVGGTDISAWLVEQGWAQSAADSGEPYAEFEEKARTEKLGVWSDGRPDTQPRELAAGG